MLKHKRSGLIIFAVSIIGVVLNLGFYALNQKALGTPLYLDTIGTLLVSASVGVLPGMLVGYFSILISALIESSQQYYSIISVLIALIVGYGASLGAFRKFTRMILILPPLVVVDTAVGVFLNWTGFFDSSPVYLTTITNNSTRFERLLSEIASTVILELIDKFISLFVVFIILKLISTVWKKDVYSFVERDMFAVSWDDQEAMKIKHSLRQTVALALAITGLVMELVSMVFIFSFYHRDRIADYKFAAEVMAGQASQIVHSGYLSVITSMNDQTPAYGTIKRSYSNAMTKFPELKAAYIYVEEDGVKKAALYCSRDGEDIPVGDVIPEVLNDNIVVVDEMIKPESGIGSLIYYSNLDILKDCYNYCARLFAVMLGVLLCIMAMIIVIADKTLVSQINRMTRAMSHFAYNSDEERLKSIAAIKALNIHNGNELEALYRSISKTVDDYTAYIEDAQKKAEEINRIQVNIISTIADLIESRDAETGQHTRRTSAYVSAIAKELQREGKFTDILTDEFIDNMTIAASLHDIGKICVSDTILNKPGKLDKDEFEIMKTHTSAGRKILIDIADNLGETEYLRIARDMAGSHHEWWDGSRGYPDGISGEDIPLSARIMAIADVFDALITVRPYKHAFTMEEAVNIIHEEKGTHFMPEIVDAFDAAFDEIVSISEEYTGREELR